MIYAIATILEEKTWQLILDQIPYDRELITSRKVKGDIPHFSWIVSSGLEIDPVSAGLKILAESKKEFITQNGGMSVFPGEEPAITLSIVRNRKIGEFHQEILDTCEEFILGINSNYLADAWIPHITLLHHGIDKSEYCSFFENCINKEIHFDITVNNIAIIYRDGEQSGLLSKFDLKKEVLSI